MQANVHLRTRDKSAPLVFVRETGAVVPFVNHRAAESLSGRTFSPHSAGIAGPIIVESAHDIHLGVELASQALE